MNYQFEFNETPGEKVWRIGERFYMIHPRHIQTFIEKCPICDGTRKVTIKGAEFDCPCCQVYRHRVADMQSINIFAFDIEEYIVNGFKVSGPEVKSAYQKDGTVKSHPIILSFEAFSKRGGNSLRDLVEVTVPRGRDLDPEDSRIISSSDVSDFGFTTIKRAKDVVKLYINREKNRLSEFNQKFGCNYKYPEEER